MIDLSTKTIEKLFLKQIADLTAKTCGREESFDFQFGEWWVRIQSIDGPPLTKEVLRASKLNTYNGG